MTNSHDFLSYKHRKYRITTNAASRMGVFLASKQSSWLNLQARYNLGVKREAVAENLAAIHPAAAVCVLANILTSTLLLPSLHVALAA